MKIYDILIISVLSFFMFSFQAEAADIFFLEAVTLNYAPSAFTDEDGNAAGIHVDIAKEAFGRIGVKYKITFLPWKRALHTVYTGSADCIIDPAYSDERARYCHFPEEPSHADIWCLFQKKGKNLMIDEELKDINYISVAIVDSFEYGGILNTALKEKRFERIYEVAEDLLLGMLVRERVDVIPGEKSNILFKAGQAGIKNKIETVRSLKTDNDLIISESPTYIAFSKKTVSIDFVNKFSDVISEMKKDGTCDIIKNRYLK